MGAGVDSLKSILEGNHAFSKELKAAKRPIIIVGSSALQRGDSSVLLAKIQTLCNSLRSSGSVDSTWRVLNVLQRVASQVAALDLGYSAGAEKIRTAKPKVLFMLGADEGVIKREDLAAGSFIIYQGE